MTLILVLIKASIMLSVVVVAQTLLGRASAATRHLITGSRRNTSAR